MTRSYVEMYRDLSAAEEKLKAVDEIIRAIRENLGDLSHHNLTCSPRGVPHFKELLVNLGRIRSILDE